jgi:two-component system NarL family response regulator
MQRKVVRLLALGCSVAEAGRLLGISAFTVEQHKSRAMSRLGLRKTATLTRYAIESGISPIGDVLTNDERRLLDIP